MKLSDLSIETNKSEYQSKVTQLSFCQSIIHPSNKSSKLYLGSVSFPSPPVNYSVLNSSHCIDGEMLITSLHNGVRIPLIFSSRSCYWYVNYGYELTSTCEPDLFDSDQRCPGRGVALRGGRAQTLWSCATPSGLHNRTMKVYKFPVWSAKWLHLFSKKIPVRHEVSLVGLQFLFLQLS